MDGLSQATDTMALAVRVCTWLRDEGVKSAAASDPEHSQIPDSGSQAPNRTVGGVTRIPLSRIDKVVHYRFMLHTSLAELLLERRECLSVFSPIKLRVF